MGVKARIKADVPFNQKLFSDNVVISNFKRHICSTPGCGRPICNENKSGKCNVCNANDKITLMLATRGIKRENHASDH